MDHILAVSLATMQHDMQRLDRIALNLANVTTPGYKREVIASRPFVEVLDQTALSTQDPLAGAISADSAASNVRGLLDVRPGTLRMTGEPLDLALAGDGFFEVATAEGMAYTRQGNFSVDARGRLVTAQGHAVMGKNGEIFLATLRPAIDSTGNITELLSASPVGGAPGAQLKVVRFDNPASMQRLGDGLLAAGAGMVVAGDDVQIRQGALENANVSTVQEMVQLMQTMRHFESMQKVATGYDEMLGSAIRKLGELS
jgi:flagellar basal-body rod protein FlgG